MNASRVLVANRNASGLTIVFALQEAATFWLAVP